MFFPARLPIGNQHLTAREAEVLLLIAEGMTTTDIAEKLVISDRTVKRHKENIRLRFGLKGHHSLQLFGHKWLAELERWAR